mgnify:FL=1
MKKRFLLTLAMALAAVTCVAASDAPAVTTAVHRGCHKMGVRRPGRNGTTHHHVKKVKRAAKPVATNAAPATVAQSAPTAAK